MVFKTNTIQYKEKVTPLLDKYALFRWAGYNMWEKFNAFIINEKSGSLKVYNGPSFSNNYTKPQFETASSRLTGVTFNTQEISFTIGVYAVTEELYRELIYVLHPYEINMLGFDFEPEYGYMVKLAKIQDSTRWVIGKTVEDGVIKDLYYTELQLTFDIQGDAVARSFNQVSFTYNTNPTDNTDNTIASVPNCKIKENEKMSDLPTPIKLNFNYKPISDGNHRIRFYIEMKANSDDKYPITKDLFYMNLKNLVKDTNYKFEYNSENGNVLLMIGNDLHLVSLLTTYNSGKRIIEKIESNIFYMPGKWDLKIASSSFDWNNFTLYMEYDSTIAELDWSGSSSNDTYGIIMYRRTNLI